MNPDLERLHPYPFEKLANGDTGDLHGVLKGQEKALAGTLVGLEL